MDTAEKELLFDTSQKVTKLHALLVENGYAQAVEDTAKEVKKLSLRMDDAELNRESYCLYKKDMNKQKEKQEVFIQRRLDMRYVLISAAIALFVGLPGIIKLGQEIAKTIFR